MVVLAQLAEHRIVVPSVVGSSPTFHPQTSFGMSFFFCVSVGKRNDNPTCILRVSYVYPTYIVRVLYDGTLTKT